MNVRDLIEGIRRELRDTDLQPDRAAELLTKLSALIGNCNDEIRVAQADYANVLLTFLNTEQKANRAKIRAELSPEYGRMRQAKDIKEVCIEMIGSLKYLVRSKMEEMRLAR